ncbi:hypothetical protein [Legionella qingyii]|nr:hypothetical protein [Legionella qingyii]
MESRTKVFIQAETNPVPFRFTLATIMTILIQMMHERDEAIFLLLFLG